MTDSTLIEPTLAFFFPGQGSQSKGMIAELIADEKIVADTVSEASDHLGYDMKEVMLENADGLLDQTDHTQPALLTASTAMLRLYRHRGGPEAAHLAGHSLGEYSALVAANAIAFADAVTLVAFRGEMMMKAVPAGVGRMAAIIGLNDEALTHICAETSSEGDSVWAANFNCPGQLVIAGHAAAVERAMELAKAAGARRALPLAVSAPSHTPLMQPAADAMQQRLETIIITNPDRPVWSNTLATPLESVTAIRLALVAQLVSPVRWTETIENIYAEGVRSAIEIGPGKVLAGLVRRINKKISVSSSDTPAAMDTITGEY